jgi:hypothetical protein
MSVSGLPTFLISVKNMNLLPKNGGTDTKPMGKTEPQFLSDPMSDRKKKVFANSVIPNVWYNSYLRFCH